MSNLRLKCTKFDFGWGSIPYPAGGAYSALPGPLLDLRGPYFYGEVEGRDERRKRRG